MLPKETTFEAKKSSVPQKAETTKKAEPSTFQSIVDAFDIVNRCKTLTVSKRPSAESAAFDIVRFISMSWVVLSHNYLIRGEARSADLFNPKFMNEIAADWNVTLIATGFYAVDFFLFMGGYVAIISLQKIVFQFAGSKWWKFPILY